VDAPFVGADNSLLSLNGIVAADYPAQTFATGTTGTDFNISSTGSTHTFNIPDASASNRGLVTTGAQTIGGAKTFSSTLTANIGSQTGGTLSALSPSIVIAGTNDSSSVYGKIRWDFTGDGITPTNEGFANWGYTSGGIRVLGWSYDTATILSLAQGGNVGIGTENPTRPLEISRNTGSMSGTVSNPATLRLRDTDTAGGGTASTTEPYASVEFYSDDTSNGGARVRALIGSIYDDEFASRTGLTFRVTGQTGAAFEAMKIANTGAVTLGPATGGGLTHTVQSGAATVLSVTAGASSEATLAINSASSQNVNLRWQQNGVNRWNIYHNNSNSSLGFYNNTAVAEFGSISSTGAWTLGPANNNNSVQHIVNGRLTIDFGDGSQIVTIGVSDDATVSGSTHYISVGSNVLPTGTTGGSLTPVQWHSASGALVRITSSQKYKTEIQDLPVGLTEVLALTPRVYERVGNPGVQEYGLIAEEVDLVLPTLVSKIDGETEGLNEFQFKAVLVKAIQELKAELDEAKDRIAQLEAAP
jgi:hypothetical protein